MSKKKLNRPFQKIKLVVPLILGSIFVDQLTKLIVLYSVSKGQTVHVFSFFNFVLTFNTGVSFGLFQSNGMLGFWILISIAVSLCIWLAHTINKSNDSFDNMACSLIIGGAIGNISDRFIYGGVVDFLQFHVKEYYWPSFNMADSFIVIGVTLVLGHQTWHSFKKSVKN